MNHLRGLKNNCFVIISELFSTCHGYSASPVGMADFGVQLYFKLSLFCFGSAKCRTFLS